jgi:hypothetical protein
MLRKFTKSKAIFPTDGSIRKAVFLSVKKITKKWTQPIRAWSMAYSQIWYTPPIDWRLKPVGRCPTPRSLCAEPYRQYGKTRKETAPAGYRIRAASVGALSSVAPFMPQ